MTETPNDATLARLDDQIQWYGSRSGSNQRWYKGFKVIAMVAAGIIPVLAVVTAPPVISAALGAVILGVESLQQLNQYHENWISYRSTAEGLKHEKFLYLAHAGPYARAREPHAMLAVRVESLISQEHNRWEQIEEEAGKDSHPA